MGIKLQKPILIGGLGFTFVLWVLESLQHAVPQGTIFLGLAALGAGGFWWLQRQSTQPLTLPAAEKVPINRETVEQRLQQVEFLIDKLLAEAAAESAESAASLPQVVMLRQRLSHLRNEFDRQDIRIAVVGGKSVGKTTLIRQLVTHALPELGWNLFWTDTADLFSLTTDRGVMIPALPEIEAADLVVFITIGDITDSEFRILQQLSTTQRRALLVFNKQDQYLPDERSIILQQLQNRLQPLMAAPDVVAIAAQPSSVKVRQHQLDGQLREWMESRQPEIKPFTERLSQVLHQSGEQLVLASMMRQAQMLKVATQASLNAVYRDRTLPQIEQYQWIAAATAFVNPVPTLDLLAIAAVNAQMIVDIGKVYGFSFSTEQAKSMAGTLASLMLKLGLVELSTQVVSGVLKSNALTFVAGGLVQGLSAAHLTQISGLSLIEHFEELKISGQPLDISALSLEGLNQKLQTFFQKTRQATALQTFVWQGVKRLMPEVAVPTLAASTAEPIQLNSRRLDLPDLKAIELLVENNSSTD
ncbi:MAG: DUF697 domain-containing protein [Cyanothece sp. SIO1E1]|nr:DUF697 domain-containing protein [Cyanothece sp. SIO1E1]